MPSPSGDEADMAVDCDEGKDGRGWVMGSGDCDFATG